MDFENIIQDVQDNWQMILLVGIASLVVLLIILRIFKTMRIYRTAKRYAKKSKKLRRKKHNGIMLIDRIKKKRKKDTNSFKKLKSRGKTLVKRYYTYKLVELPMITKYSYGKLLKRSSEKLVIFVKDDKKIIKKFSNKKGVKGLISITNKYECLNESIHFLHNLSEAILEQQEYEIYLSEQHLTMGYMIK